MSEGTDLGQDEADSSKEILDLRILFLVMIEIILLGVMYKTNETAELGTYVHACEGEIVCESTNVKIPYFNAPIYLQNKACLPPESPSYSYLAY